jgi:penicillin-binding protein 2
MRVEKSPKILFFAAVIGLTFGGLVFRLFDLQIVRGEGFVARADANRFFSERLPPERGVIFDRYGQPLVVNIPEYYQIMDTEALYSKHSPLDSQEALYLMATNSAHVAYQLRRQYLYPQQMAHVLGYVGAVTAEDLGRSRELNGTDIIGKMGLEKVFDMQLRGQAGSKVYEINALGERQRLVGEKPQVSGTNVATTLDPYLSAIAFEALGDQRGAAVILDADTGDVLSLVSKPSFDLNIMTSHYLDDDRERERLIEVKEMISHPLQLFFNRAVGGTYPPGSVFKLITAMAGLDSGALDAKTQVVDQGTLEVGEYSFANWYYTQYGGVEGAISLQRALSRSNDIYFYKAAEWVGPTKIADMARLFGLGKHTGILLTGEAGGLVPDPNWKEKTLGEPWYLGNTFHFGIGQDNLLVTPLQIAAMTQAFAKQGSLCQPQLEQTDSIECSELGLKEEDLQLVLKGMLGACSSGGTAFPFFERNSKYLSGDQVIDDPEAVINRGAVACKTGTAEFGSTDEKGYKKTHGWFVAIFGTESLGINSSEAVNNIASTSASNAEIAGSQATGSANIKSEWLNNIKKTEFPKRLVVAVLVESDELQPYKEGSRDAAPVVKTILDWIDSARAEQTELSN